MQPIRLSAPPTIDLTSVVEWLDAAKREAVTNGDHKMIDDLRRRVEQVIGMTDELNLIPIMLQATRDRIAAREAQCAGHDFVFSQRLCGRCEICEGYEDDHVHVYSTREWENKGMCLICWHPKDHRLHKGDDR